jgi:hypothetical protein
MNTKYSRMQKTKDFDITQEEQGGFPSFSTKLLKLHNKYNNRTIRDKFYEQRKYHIMVMVVVMLV